MVRIILLCLLLPLYGFAQPATELKVNFGGDGFDRALFLQQLSDGGYILCGYTNSYGSDDDILLIKTNPEGEIRWQKNFAHHKNDIGWGVIELPDKSLMVHGSTAGTDSLEDDILVLKLDKNGNEYWRKTFGNRQHERTTHMLLTRDGYLTLIGQRNAISGNDINSYVLKIDLNGKLISERTYGSPFPERTFYAVEKSDGELLLSGLILPYQNRKADIYLLCLNSRGDSLWSKSIGDSSVHEIAHSFNRTGHPGRYVLTGYIESDQPGYHDALWMEVDEKGNVLSKQRYGTGDDIRLMHAEQSTDKGWVITGYVKKNPQENVSDLIVMKLNEKGGFVWEKRFGDADKDDQGYWLVVNKNQTYTIAGYTYSYGVKGDIWLLRIKE